MQSDVLPDVWQKAFSALVDHPTWVAGRDRHLRDRHFVQESYEHQAKMNLWAVSEAIKRYTMPGDLVLDVMGGSGSVLWGATLGRRVLVGDIEDHWSALLAANCRSLASSWLFPVSVAASQWDARALPLAAGVVDVILTSPPYWDTFSDWHIASRNLQGGHAQFGPAYSDERGRPSSERRNIGNVHVYELYLREMVRVWRECNRVLQPGRRLIVFVKDRVHQLARVPIVRDTAACLAGNGFLPVAMHSLALPESRYRRLNRELRPDSPDAGCETLLIVKKGTGPGVNRDFALLQGPGRLAPGGLFDKTMNYARAHHDEVIVLPEDPPGRAIPRKRWGYEVAAGIVFKNGLAAGDRITVYAGRLVGQYVAQRLETVGCNMVWTWSTLNQGQRLRWLTERGF